MRQLCKMLGKMYMRMCKNMMICLILQLLNVDAYAQMSKDQQVSKTLKLQQEELVLLIDGCSQVTTTNELLIIITRERCEVACKQLCYTNIISGMLFGSSCMKKCETNETDGVQNVCYKTWLSEMKTWNEANTACLNCANKMKRYNWDTNTCILQ